MVIIGYLILTYCISALTVYWLYGIDSVYNLGKQLFEDSGDLALLFKGNYNQYLKLIIFFPILNTLLVLIFIGGGLFGLIKYLIINLK